VKSIPAEFQIQNSAKSVRSRSFAERDTLMPAGEYSDDKDNEGVHNTFDSNASESKESLLILKPMNKRETKRMSVLIEKNPPFTPSLYSTNMKINISEVRQINVAKITLSVEEKRQLSVILHWLISSPKILFAACACFRTTKEFMSLAELIVQRIFRSSSTDIKAFESLLLEMSAYESTESEKYLINKEIQNVDKDGIQFFNELDATSSPLLSGRRHQAVQLIPYVIVEVTQCTEVSSFVRFICVDDINSAVASYCSEETKQKPPPVLTELAFKVVEPICRRLEATIAAGTFPDRIQSCIVTLQRCGHFLTPNAILAEFIVPHVMRYLSIRLQHMCENEVDESDPLHALNSRIHTHLVQKLRYAFLLTFDVINNDESNHGLCLSDSAALSRSKWYVSRSLEILLHSKLPPLQDQKQFSLPNQPSPVALLALLNQSNKSDVMKGTICLKPSDLGFLLFDCVGIESRIIQSSQQHNNLRSKSITSSAVELSSPYYLQGSRLNNSSIDMGDLDRRIDAAIRYISTSECLQRYQSLFAEGEETLDGIITYTFFTAVNNPLFDYMQTALYPDAYLPLADRNTTSEESKLMDLLPPSQSALIGQQDCTEAWHLLQQQCKDQLSSIAWTVNAARTALKVLRVQNGGMLPHPQHFSVMELVELNQSLQSKRGLIKECQRDLQCLKLNKDICHNLKSQLSVQLDSVKKIISESQLMSPNQGLIVEAMEPTLRRFTFAQFQLDHQLLHYKDSPTDHIAHTILQSPDHKHKQVNDSFLPSPAIISSNAVDSTVIEEKMQQNSTPFKLLGRVKSKETSLDLIDSTNYAPDAMSSPNPLWIIMQNVFSPKK